MPKIVKNSPILVLLIAVMGLFACDRSRVYEEYRAVGAQGWHLDSAQTFVWEYDEGDQRYDAFMALRVNSDYPYQNLYVFVDQRYANGQERRDTVNYRLAAPSGELLGKGMGAVKEFLLPVFLDGTLPEAGEYSITLTHGMRDTQLVGIEDVGFRLALHESDS